MPFIFELLASIPRDYPVDLSSLRLCISGSAPLANSVASAFSDRFGTEIRQRYGGSHIHPALKGVPGAVGATYGAFPIVILNEDEQPALPDRIGEIVFDYDRVESSWQKYLAENSNRRGRYIHTGDLGRADADGNVFVVGWKSPFIKVRGNRVEPAEVEAVLRAYPNVTEAVVYGKAASDGNEEVRAIVANTGTVSRRDLLRHCAERLDGFKCPRDIEFRSELPRNQHGKLDRLNLFKSPARLTSFCRYQGLTWLEVIFNPALSQRSRSQRSLKEHSSQMVFPLLVHKRDCRQLCESSLAKSVASISGGTKKSVRSPELAPPCSQVFISSTAHARPHSGVERVVATAP